MTVSGCQTCSLRPRRERTILWRGVFGVAFVSLLSTWFAGMATSAAAMTPMADDELAVVTGQALMQMGKEAGTRESEGLMFYKAGLDIQMELNMNIEKLQLGCTATAIDGQYCDIDIRNLAITGAPDVQGMWPDGRPASDAVMTRPFFEFAIANDDTKTMREVVGIRLSAESITGMLTAGTDNHGAPVADDGIQSLSGFMRIAPTTGEVTTQQSVFGLQPDELISGHLRANALVGNFDRNFTSIYNHVDTHGITIPSMSPGFSMPGFQVNGRRQTLAKVEGVSTVIDEIPMSLEGCQAANGVNCVNQLRVQLSSNILTVSSSKVRLANGSRLEDLHLDVTFNQHLSMIHNVPLSGTGMYLSFQKRPVYWPGAYVGSGVGTDQSDIAQPGWWMSFKDEVDLGYLQGQVPVDISDVFPQVATLVSQNMMQPSQRIELEFGDAMDALFDALVQPPNPVIVNLRDATDPTRGGTPASITLEHLQLVNQAVTPNCWGNARFC